MDQPHAHAPVIGLELVRCHALSLAEIKNDKVADEKQIKREIIEVRRFSILYFNVIILLVWYKFLSVTTYNTIMFYY